jgi:uncharacterized protein YjiS (DUF1127 family)
MSLAPVRGAFAGSISAGAATTPAANTPSAPLKRVFAALRAPFKKLSAALRHRRELEQLARFSDRELRDLAVTRNDVAFALAEPLWRDPAEAFRQVRSNCAERISTT